MSTTISSPFGAPYEENPAVRFVDTTTLPPTVPAAPPGGFPQTPPRRAGVITQSIDDTLITPSAHMLSAVVGRELGRNFAMEVGYLGRFGRDLLIRRDLAMPLNLTDTASGHGLLHRGAGDHQGRAGARHHRQFAGDGLRGAARNGLLGEPVPGSGRRRL